MRRKQLAINTNSSSSSDNDLRQVLNIYQHHRIRNFDNKTYNNLCRLCIKLLKIEQVRISYAFSCIKTASQQYERKMQYRYSKMHTLENKYKFVKQNDNLKIRSRSENVDKIEKVEYDMLGNIFRQKLKLKEKKENQEEKINGKAIISRLNNLSKLLKSIKKQAKVFNKQPVTMYAPTQYIQYSRHNSQKHFYHQPMIQSRYHVFNKNDSYLYHQNPSQYYNLQNRSIYRPVSIPNQQQNNQRSQRLRTQQTVSLNRQKQSEFNMIQQIKQLKNLIQLNIQITQRNNIRIENRRDQQAHSNQHRQQQSQQQQSQQQITHKVTMRQKQTQPTYRSHQIQTLNFQQQDFSKKKDKPLNYVSQKKSIFKRYNTGGSYND